MLGLTLAVAGVGALLWTLVAWQWGDPFTGAYTTFRQLQLADEYAQLVRSRGSSDPRSGELAAAARRLRRHAGPGDPIARIRVERVGLDMIVVEDTDSESLKSGPGRDHRSFLPGEGELVYIAGHRTTYRAPFSDLDRLRVGDLVSLETPYGRFVYAVSGHRVVAADDLSVLRSPHHEVLRLQACHPRFFASRRYVVSARLVQRAPIAPAAPAGV